MSDSRTAEDCIATYFRAKDGNKPHLMTIAFNEHCRLEVAANTVGLAFPPVSVGLRVVTDVLVRDFNRTYENIYSYALQRPPAISLHEFACEWLVVMSEKNSGKVRVGCGRYDWHFQQSAPFLVDRLCITIEAMQVLAPDTIRGVLSWAMRLPYPWCEPDIAAESAPRMEVLEPIRTFLGRERGAKGADEPPPQGALPALSINS